jgi:hypothetical protein
LDTVPSVKRSAVTAEPRPVEQADRRWRVDALALAIATVAIRLPAFFAEKSLVFDDGVFASSVRAMRHGALPFRDVFSSQGPAFLPLLWLGDLAGVRTLDAPRVLSVASGVVLTIAVYACARHVTTRANALLAAGLVTTSGSVLWVTVPVNADGPSLALSVLAVAFALRYRDRPRPRTAVWVGLAAGAAMSIKPLTAPAVVVAGLVVLLADAGTDRGRRAGLRDAATAVGAAVAVYLVAALPFGIADVWDQSVTYHEDARPTNSPAGALHDLVSTLWDRDKLVVVAVGLAAVTFVVRLVCRRRAGRPADHTLGVVVAFLALWSVLVVALLVFEPALWRAHVSHVIPPLALLAALRPPSWKVLLVAAIVTVPLTIASNTSILWPGGYEGERAALVRYLATSKPAARFISDDPGLVWRADRNTPPNFADTSYVRIDDHRITARSVTDAARDHQVCGVVVTSPTRFGRLQDLPGELAAEGFHPVAFGSGITLYQRGEGATLAGCPRA